MPDSNLRQYLRPGLDILFVALNPPVQSNDNCHWFSGKQSCFFDLLYRSGIISEYVDKRVADDIVFGGTGINYQHANYGVVDLVGNVVETNSTKVKPIKQDVDRLVARILETDPRIVCVIHSKVRTALSRYGNLARPLEYGDCGALLHGSGTHFVLSSFPNGSNIPESQRLQIFGLMREQLGPVSSLSLHETITADSCCAEHSPRRTRPLLVPADGHVAKNVSHTRSSSHSISRTAS